jgi:fatty-acyl-CoA synthase
VAIVGQLRSGAALARSFMTPFERPDRLPRAIRAMMPWGSSIAGLLAGGAARYPDRIAIHDDAGATSYRELYRRSLAIAASLRDDGVGPGTGVGLLARNHRGFVETTAAVAATGADLVLLNTGFAAPQLADVVTSEGIDVVAHDDEFDAVVAGCGARCIGERELAAMSRSGTIGPRREQGRVVILTSGTTGRPKGAARSNDPSGIAGIAAMLDRIPLRLGDTQVIAAPMFHSWGLSHLLLGLARCSTNVVTRRFDPERTLRDVHDHRAEVLVVVPVMLSRMLATGRVDRAEMSDLRVIASSGSALGSRLTTDVLEAFGPVLYNLYGSTEVAAATIAGPDDLLAAPNTAGRIPLGVRVEILDGAGRPVAPGATGRIFVGGAMRFDGYTDGGSKEERDGLLSSGDVGHFRDGLLFVEGRDDDMIVSGGENVFPNEVEDLLHQHPEVADVAVIGVPDDEFGQALAAYVVRGPGAALTEQQVREHVRDHLARHKVPRVVTFVDELPRNATGKLLRRDLTPDA